MSLNLCIPFSFHEQEDMTALYFASAESHIDVVKMLVQAKADVELQDKVEWFQTYWATVTTKGPLIMGGQVIWSLLIHINSGLQERTTDESDVKHMLLESM